MKVIEVPSSDKGARETVQRFLDNEKELEGVMVVALLKEDSPVVYTSMTSGMQKSYMVHTAQNFLMKWMSGEVD